MEGCVLGGREGSPGSSLAAEAVRLRLGLGLGVEWGVHL